MRTTLLVSAIAVLFHVASAQGFFGLQCSNSDVCPEGSKCVYSSCVDCTCDPESCFISMEVCDNLHCKDDEGCFLKKEADYGGNVIKVTPQCAKTNPCPPGTCGNGETCVPIYCGQQPPIFKCRPNSFANPCDGAKCPEGSSCVVNYAQCYGIPCNFQLACGDFSACKDCNWPQICDMQLKSKGDGSNLPLVIGQCASYKPRGFAAKIQAVSPNDS